MVQTSQLRTCYNINVGYLDLDLLAVAAGRGHATRAAHSAGAAFGGAKIWNSEIWLLLANF